MLYKNTFMKATITIRSEKNKQTNKKREHALLQHHVTHMKHKHTPPVSGLAIVIHYSARSTQTCSSQLAS